MPAMLIRSFLFWAAVAACLLYWVIVGAVPYYERQISLHALRMCMAAAVVIAYAPVWLEALATAQLTKVQQLSLGIGCTWVGVIGSGFWSGLWLVAGQPDWMLVHPINGFWHWLTIWGGVLHVTAPRALDGRVPRQQWALVGAAVGTALLVAAVVLYFAGAQVGEFARYWLQPEPIAH